MVVVDASVVVELLRGPASAARVAQRLASEPAPLHAPHLIDAEVAQVLRRLVASGSLTAGGGAAALDALLALPLLRHPHPAVLVRAWAMRANLTVYDALYVALAERLGATLLTCDARLAGAPGIRAPVEVL